MGIISSLKSWKRNRGNEVHRYHKDVPNNFIDVENMETIDIRMKTRKNTEQPYVAYKGLEDQFGDGYIATVIVPEGTRVVRAHDKIRVKKMYVVSITGVWDEKYTISSGKSPYAEETYTAGMMHEVPVLSENTSEDCSEDGIYVSTSKHNAAGYV